MVVFLILAAIVFCTPQISAESINPLYSLPPITQKVSAKKPRVNKKDNTNIQKKTGVPEKISPSEVAIPDSSRSILVGSDIGLFRVTETGVATALWTDGRVEQILRNEISSGYGQVSEEWFFRTSEGILFSSDLTNFELRNDGLPFLTIKEYNGTEISFKHQVAELKDLHINPLAHNEMVTATKGEVYISYDSGKNWKSLGSMSAQTPGIKAVASGVLEDGRHVVFMSHTIFGLSYILPDVQKPSWIDVTRGLFIMPSLSYPDEISDILPVVQTAHDGAKYTEIYLSQMYVPRIYRFNWEEKRAENIYIGREPADSIDGLTYIDNSILYVCNETLKSVNVDTLLSNGTPSKFSDWKNNLNATPGMVSSAWIPKSRSGFSAGVLLNELWLLYPGTVNTPYAAAALDKKSIYVSAYQCRLQSGIDRFKKIIKDNNLNSLVIDMKDDYGLLRYDTNDPIVKEKGYVTQYKIDLDHFVNEFKKDDIYLIARIVVFKDKNLWQYNGGKYAVWNKSTNARWQGTKKEEVLDEETNEISQVTALYDEFWVDPYSPEVWEYNVAIAKELVARGFDEIQFDYIRFPTDGLNLYEAQYRHRSAGMDKESALISFLSYARENIDAPIGIDIYGANGWYRSGTRTGQDAELLAEYVDVICPMFYPSHFERSFLYYEPIVDRTYRIYYYGTYRASILARNRAVIRPWVQAFRLAYLSFDRLYYGPDYIQKQIFGVRDSVDRGYMYWNNSGDYDYLLPDVTASDAYTGKAMEASTDFRKPALGTSSKQRFIGGGISVLDSVLRQSANDNLESKKRTETTSGVNSLPTLKAR